MVGSYVQLDPDVKLDDGVRIQPYTSIATGTIVGKNVFFGPYVSITNAPFPPSRILYTTVIDDGAVFGSHAVILPGVKIGKEAVVGSNSLVTRNVPSREVWLGSPATFRYTRATYDERMKNAGVVGRRNP